MTHNPSKRESLNPVATSTRRSIKKLLIDRTTAIAYVVKQFTHDPKLDSLNIPSANTKRNDVKMQKLLLVY